MRTNVQTSFSLLLSVADNWAPASTLLVFGFTSQLATNRSRRPVLSFDDEGLRIHFVREDDESMKPPSNVKTPAQYIASLPFDRAKTADLLRRSLVAEKLLLALPDRRVLAPHRLSERVTANQHRKRLSQERWSAWLVARRFRFGVRRKPQAPRPQ